MRSLRILAWAFLVGIAVVTLSPIEFRPETGLPAQAERFLAFLFAGLVFTLAYRRHFVLAAVLLVGVALVLELGQLAAPTRHSGVSDLEAKVLGLICGMLLGRLLSGLWKGQPRPGPPPPPAEPPLL